MGCGVAGGEHVGLRLHGGRGFDESQAGHREYEDFGSSAMGIDAGHCLDSRWQREANARSMWS
jgi:hypothetical protein